MNKLRKPVVRNPMAKEVRTPKYAKRIVRSRKGSGSYTRSTVTKSRLDGFYDSWTKALMEMGKSNKIPVYRERQLYNVVLAERPLIKAHSL